MKIEENSRAVDQHITSPDNKVGSSDAENEETARRRNWRIQSLSLEIPSRKFEGPEDAVKTKMNITPKRVNFMLTPTLSDMKSYDSPGSSLVRGGSGLKNILPKFGFIYRSSSDVDKAASTAVDIPCTTPKEKTSISRSSSLTKMFTARIRRTASLPVAPNAGADSTQGSSTSGSLHSCVKEARLSEAAVHISRSFSDPLNKGKHMKSMDSYIRVIPSPRVTSKDLPILNSSETVKIENAEATGEDIPEEEAVCRICFVELCEGGETLKLECSCKGELALAHKECALKWFSIKGNKTCDVCKKEVENLPVTLLRVQSTNAANTGANIAQRINLRDYRAWQEVPVLVIVSMLAYFCFLEQLLVAKMGTGAIALSLPFSCVLGLLSAMTSSTMVTKRFVWIYASMQFALVVIFGHVFYSAVRLQAIMSILLATFTGYGIAMGVSSVIIEFLRWRRRNAQSHTHQASQVAAANNQQPDSAWTDLPNNRPADVESQETFSGS